MQLVSQWWFVQRELQDEGCYTLQRVCAFFSIKASRLDDAHAFAVMETLRDKLLKGCYTMQCWKKLLQSLQKVEPDSTLCNNWRNLSRNDFDHCTARYTVQWSVQLVSQRFWPLPRSMLHGAMARATCLATILTIAQHVTRCNGPCSLSRNTVARQVPWKIAPCNRALKMLHKIIFNDWQVLSIVQGWHVSIFRVSLLALKIVVRNRPV